jgi:hypothetical protein
MFFLISWYRFIAISEKVCTAIEYLSFIYIARRCSW